MECLCSLLRRHFAWKLVVAKCRLFSQDNSVKVPILKVRGTNRNHCQMTYSQSGTPVWLFFGVHWLGKMEPNERENPKRSLCLVFVSGNVPYNYPLGLKGGFVHSGENKFLRDFKELIIILFHQFRTAEKWLKSLAIWSKCTQNKTEREEKSRNPPLSLFRYWEKPTGFSWSTSNGLKKPGYFIF